MLKSLKVRMHSGSSQLQLSQSEHTNFSWSLFTIKSKLSSCVTFFILCCKVHNVQLCWCCTTICFHHVELPIPPDHSTVVELSTWECSGPSLLVTLCLQLRSLQLNQQWPGLNLHKYVKPFVLNAGLWSYKEEKLLKSGLSGQLHYIGAYQTIRISWRFFLFLLWSNLEYM